MYLSPTAQGIVPVWNVDKPVGANKNLKPANPFREPALRRGWLDRADGQIVKVRLGIRLGPQTDFTFVTEG